ncbi:MAG: energy transducer TonB [Bacteroidota bacterium]
MKKLLYIAIAFLAIQLVSAHQTKTNLNDSIYNTAELDKIPDFPEGMNEFYNFIRKNYNAPSEGLSDKVLVRFIIEKDGSLSNFKVLKSVNYDSDKEAVRVLSICPNWIPGEKNGQKVRCKLTLPISKLIYNYQTHTYSAQQKSNGDIYNSAGIEKKPEFPGGMEEFHKFLKKNYKPSPEVKGLAFVTFIIEKDGSLSNFKLLRDPGFGAGEEALRVLSICPKWSPGERKGEKVRCVFNTSIPYREPIKTITKRISE